MDVLAAINQPESCMHKNTKLLPYQRVEIYRRWCDGASVATLAREYRVSRQTIYKVNRNARLKVFHNRSSENRRYRCVAHGLRRLAQTEAWVALKKARRERRRIRYEKTIPGELVHFDTKRLPLLRGEGIRGRREYLFVAIDDYSRFLFADILPDKTSHSAAIFLEEARRFFAFPIECAYSDNGSEYKGKPGHPFVDLCAAHGIAQRLTRVRRPQTNGKAERVIRTLMEEWHAKSWNFENRDKRRRYLFAYVDWYNQVRRHSAIDGSPLERLESFLLECEQRLRDVQK